VIDGFFLVFQVDKCDAFSTQQKNMKTLCLMNNKIVKVNLKILFRVEGWKSKVRG
jgi:hypothetical protein